jgi:hypothetical protein
VEANTIEMNRLGFAGYTGTETADLLCHDYQVRDNVFRDNRIGAQFERVRSCVVEGNNFTDSLEAALRLVNRPDVTSQNNHFANNRVDQDEAQTSEGKGN